MQIHAQQAPQRVDFRSRPLPVLRREGIQRQRLNPQSRAGFHGDSNRFDAGFVAGRARQISFLGPTSVAVHDDRNMGGQAVRIDGVGECPVLAAGLQNLEDIFHPAKYLWYTGTPAAERRHSQKSELSLRAQGLVPGQKHFPEETNSQSGRSQERAKGQLIGGCIFSGEPDVAQPHQSAEQ